MFRDGGRGRTAANLKTGLPTCLFQPFFDRVHHTESPYTTNVIANAVTSVFLRDVKKYSPLFIFWPPVVQPE